MTKRLRDYAGLAGIGLWWLTVGVYALLALTHPPTSLASKLWVAAVLLASGIVVGVGVRRVLLVLVLTASLWLFSESMLAFLSVITAALTTLTVLRFRLGSRHLTLFGRHRWFFYPVGIRTEDRFLHTHVLGPTGSGKSSSVLMPIIWQDLYQGHGISLIEPKGDLSLATMRAALDTGHTVLYVDPDDPKAPHYNPLSGPAAVAAEGLAWALDQASESGHPFYATVARLELLYAVLAVKEAAFEDTDVPMIMRFLRQDGFRRDVLNACQDPRTLAYYAEQVGRQSQAKAHEQRIGLLNRLELLLVNPRVRNILEGPGDFTWDEVLHEGHVVICPFSLARLGISARLLGNLFWHGLVMATYRRPATDRTPYFLFIDEFHQFVSPDLGDYLALARGYKVGITLAHQDLGQLSAELKSAVMANCRQRVILGGISGEDQKELERSLNLNRQTPPDFRHLPLGRAFVERTAHGQLKPAVMLQLFHRSLESKASS